MFPSPMRRGDKPKDLLMIRRRSTPIAHSIRAKRFSAIDRGGTKNDEDAPTESTGSVYVFAGEEFQ